MEIDFNSYLSEFEKYQDSYEKLLNKTFKLLSIKCDPIISVSIVDKKTIQQINKEYRNIDKETDVISFAFLDNEENKDSLLNSSNPVVLGDIYICSDVAIEHAKEYSNTIDREMNFLFVHGLLHLLGYDHMNKEDEEVMFPLQEEVLKND